MTCALTTSPPSFGCEVQSIGNIRWQACSLSPSSNEHADILQICGAGRTRSEGSKRRGLKRCPKQSGKLRQHTAGWPLTAGPTTKTATATAIAAAAATAAFVFVLVLSSDPQELAVGVKYSQHGAPLLPYRYLPAYLPAAGDQVRNYPGHLLCLLCCRFRWDMAVDRCCVPQNSMYIYAVCGSCSTSHNECMPVVQAGKSS